MDAIYVAGDAMEVVDVADDLSSPPEDLNEEREEPGSGGLLDAAEMYLDEMDVGDDLPRPSSA